MSVSGNRTRLSPAEEAELAVAVARGDETAWNRLFETYYECLYRFIYYRVGGRTEAAEDITQEVMLLRLKKIETYDPRKGGLYGWFCGLARNRARRFLKSVRSRSRLEKVFSNIDPQLEIFSAEFAAGKVHDETLELEETKALVGLTLSTLTPQYQFYLRKKYMEGLSTKELARLVQKNIKAVEGTLFRARKAFRAAFSSVAKGLHETGSPLRGTGGAGGVNIAAGADGGGS